MAKFLSDRFRLAMMQLPEGIDREDIDQATLAGIHGNEQQHPPNDQNDHSDPISAINRVSESLISHAEDLLEAKSAGENAPHRIGKKVPSSTISFLAWEMLIRCDLEGNMPPYLLLKLLRIQLGIRSEGRANLSIERNDQRQRASLYSILNPDASYHEIARFVKVDVATISRWDKKYNLKLQGLYLQKMITEEYGESANYHDWLGEI